MIRKGIALAPLFMALACGSAPTKAPEAPKAASTKKKPLAKAEQSEQSESSDAPGETRKVGDYFVYRYSGSYTADPITVTEQVVAEEFGLLVVDLVVEQKEKMTALRVRMQPGGKIVTVGKLDAEGETPATLADYEAVMSRTQFVPDSNDELVGSDTATCLVGKEEAECRTTTYLVRIGEKEGMLSVVKSQAVPGRDVGGEVVGPDGSLIYRAQLVEAGHEEPRANALAWAGKALRRETPAKQ